MTRGQWSGELVDRLGRLFRGGAIIGLTESELIDRFARGRDEAAFEALLARHGPMVLGVCRQLLRDPNDVDDAFQAVFLVLVRKAGTLRRGDLLGNWLYGVAYRVARRARASSARRPAQAPLGLEAVAALDESNPDRSTGPDPEPTPWLHEEVARLPEKYRFPVLLCYFEGLTHDEAAQRLGCPLGTVKGRLARARDLLRRRLTRRGVTCSAAALAAHLAAPEAHAVVPAPLQHATLKAARALALASATGGRLATASVSRTILDLVNGASRDMTINQIRAIALPVLVLSTVAVGVVGVALGLSQAPVTNPTGPAASPPAERSDATQPHADFVTKDMQKAAIPAKKSLTSNEPHPEDGPNFPRSQPQGIDDEAIIDGWTPEARNRFDIAELAAAMVVGEQNPKNESLLARLDKPMAVPFAKPTPLADVIKYIKSEAAKSGQGPLPIYVDPQGLQDADATPVTLNTTVTLDLEGAPLKASLRLLLKQVGLAYCVRDGVIIISSVQGVREELAEAARELVGAANEQINLPMLRTMGILRRRALGPPGEMMGGGSPAGAAQFRPRAGQGPGVPAKNGASQE
jgi:RNA polymerase sigma factor (sigma-70 family)